MRTNTHCYYIHAACCSTHTHTGSQSVQAILQAQQFYCRTQHKSRTHTHTHIKVAQWHIGPVAHWPSGPVTQWPTHTHTRLFIKNHQASDMYLAATSHRIASHRTQKGNTNGNTGSRANGHTYFIVELAHTHTHTDRALP